MSTTPESHRGQPAETPEPERLETRPDGANIWLILAAITLLGGALRLFRLSTYSLWYDETASIYLSKLGWTPSLLFDTAWNAEAPLTAVRVWLWHGLIQASLNPPVTSQLSDFLFRLLPWGFSTLAIPIIYFAAKGLTGSRATGLIAAFILAISPFQIYYAQELRSYAFTTALGLAALLACVRALERNRHGDYALLALLLCLLFYNHFTMVWFIFVLNIYALLVVLARHDRFLPWSLWQILLIISVIPAILLAHQANQIWLSIDYVWETYPPPTPKTAALTFKAFFAGYGPTVWAYHGLTLLAGGFFCFGLYALRRHWRIAALLALAVLLPILGNVLFWRVRTLSLYEHRIFILYGAIAVIPIAHGIRALPRPPLRLAVLGLFALLTLPLLRDHYLHRIHPITEHRIGIFDKVDYRAAARFLEEAWQPGDLLAHDSLFTIYSMKHYLPEEQHHLDLGEDPMDADLYAYGIGNVALYRNHGLMPVPAEEATQGAARIWLIEAQGLIFDEGPQSIPAREWLAARYTHTEEHDFDGLRLTLFVP